MRCFTFSCGKLQEGLALTNDERLGQVVFLGEDGRGRRFEKVALGRRNPADVVNGRVIEAQPVKITLPARDGKPEKVFYVLEKPANGEGELLVRVYTYTAYIRGGRGYWQTVAGKPETLVSGYGAFGDAGRIGNWDDGLIVLRPGDVLRVYPSRGDSSALWVGADGRPVTTSWKDFENIQAVAKAQAVIAEAVAKPEALQVVFATMRTFTFAGDQVTAGLKVTKGATGPVIAFGEAGRGRERVEVPLVGFEPSGETVETAAVAKLDEKVTPSQYGGEPKIKTIYGLVKTAATESAMLVRVCTGYAYTRRGCGRWETWKGNPTRLVHGSGADGDAGGIGDWADDLVVLREGDVVRVWPSGDGPTYALYAQGNEVRSEEWTAWKIADSRRNPAFYVGKNTAPWGHVPAEWVGKVVSVIVLGSRNMIGNRPTPAFETTHTGELISVSPNWIVLNLGWDGMDRHDLTVTGGLFVRLETDKQVCHPEGAEADKRVQTRAQAEELRNKAITATKQSYFGLTEVGLRSAVQKLAEEQGFDTMSTEGWYNSLTSWGEAAKAVMEKFATVEPELKTLEQRQNSGEVLVDFGGHFRVMGATGNAQYWVIQPDGTQREPDKIAYRGRYTAEGDKSWRLVGPDELALAWSKAYTAAPHEFVVAKLPAHVCTPEQLRAVSRIELEISERFHGARGMTGGAPSPEINGGWNLDAKSKPPKIVPEPATPAEPAPPAAPASAEQIGDALAALRKKFGK